MTPGIIYTPLLIAFIVKNFLIPLSKITFTSIKWTPIRTKTCVYVWSILLSTLALSIGLLGPISIDSLWVGLAASLMASTGSIGINESFKKDSDYCSPEEDSK